MPSPFPGMDPFVEKGTRWESLHAWFIRELARVSLPAAKARGCWIDVEKDVYRPDPTGELVLLGEPDDVISFRGGTAEENGGVATATLTAAVPKAIHEVIVEPYPTPSHRQQYLVVRELGQWRRDLAVIELLSPATNSGSYVPKYHEKRINLIASPTHFLEIDLLRAGHNPLRDRFPELPSTPYFIFLARKLHPDRKEEAYPLRLQEPLPVINLPLSEGRSDLPLDLGAAFRSAYDLSIGEPIQYRTEGVPEPPLTAEDAQWVQELLAK